MRLRRTPKPQPTQEELRVLARRRLRGALVSMSVSGVFLLALPSAAWAAGTGSDVHPFIQLALYLGGLSLLPFAIMTLTSFLRIVVVLSFLRSGLGAQNVPPNMVVIALALFLSLFVMGPTIDKIKTDALGPYQAKKIQFTQAMTLAQTPLKQFMVKQMGHSSRKELGMFYQLASKDQKTPRCTNPANTQNCIISPDDLQRLEQQQAGSGVMKLPMRVIIPSFIISELKKAFIMGFAVLLPFLVIDLVVSNILQALGMMMLPPVVISLPFKVLLFVLSGGWTMVVEFLVKGFNY